MLLEVLTVFIIIFVAELGDKSQILAMSFATRYSMKQVLTGVCIGILLNHVIAVIAGVLLGSILIGYQVGLFVGVIFVVFAAITLLERGEDDVSKIRQYGPILTISLAFFFGELGDKTQLATMAFASESSTPFIILIGSVTAMILVSFFGIVVGRKLGEKVPDYFVRLGSSMLFMVYGVMKLEQNFNGLNIGSTWFFVPMALILILYLALVYKSFLSYQIQGLTTFQKVAKHLQMYHNQMSEALEYICLGEDICGSCQESKCIVGHTKFLIEQSKKGVEIDPSRIQDKVFKNVDPHRLLLAITITMEEIKDHWEDPDFAVLHTIRRNLDFLLFHKNVTVETYEEYKRIIQDYRQSIDK